jgi:hypothetical protein
MFDEETLEFVVVRGGRDGRGGGRGDVIQCVVGGVDAGYAHLVISRC